MRTLLISFFGLCCLLLVQPGIITMQMNGGAGEIEHSYPGNQPESESYKTTVSKEQGNRKNAVFTSTATEVEGLPVLIGTPMPEMNISITHENADRMHNIAQWGKGVLSSISWGTAENELLVVSSQGIDRYQSTTLSWVGSQVTNRWDTYIAVSQQRNLAVMGGAWGDHIIHVIDLENGEEIWSLQGHSQTVYDAEFSDDGSMLAAALGDGTIMIWDVENRELLYELAQHSSVVKSVAFSNDNLMLASASFDHEIRLWNLKTGECETVLRGHEQEVSSIAFTPDGKYLVSGGYDQVVLRWDIEKQKYDRLIGGHNGMITSIDISTEGEVVAAASTDHLIKLWDIEGEREISTLTGHDAAVLQVVFSPDGQWLASRSQDGVLMTWDIDECMSSKYCLPDEELSDYTPRWFSATMAYGDDLAAIVMEDEIVEIWDVKTGERKTRLGYPTTGVQDVLFSVDGVTLYLGTTEGKLSEWNVSNGRKTKNLSWYSGDVRSVSISEDGKWLASGGLWGNEEISIWDIHSGKFSKKIVGHTDYVTATAFLKNDSLLVSSSMDGDVIFWYLDTGEEKCRIHVSDEGVFGMSLSPDKKNLALWTGGNAIEMVSVFTCKTQGQILTQGSTVSDVSFSFDGQILASGDWEGNVELWDILKRERLSGFKAHSGNIKTLIFLDEKLLLSMASDGMMKIWGVEP